MFADLRWLHKLLQLLFLSVFLIIMRQMSFLFFCIPTFMSRAIDSYFMFRFFLLKQINLHYNFYLSDNFVSSLIPKVKSLSSNLCSSDLCLLH